MKRKMDQRSNDGSSPSSVTSISKDENARVHILAKKGYSEANEGSSIGTGENTKEKMENNHKNVNEFGPSEKTKVNHESDGRIRKENVTKKKSKRHNGREQFISSGKFCDEGTSCSENLSIDYFDKESRKYEGEQKKNMKKEKHKGITDINLLRNASAGVENLNDEISYGGLMGRDKVQKKQKKEMEKHKVSENSTTCTDNSNLNEAIKLYKKRKMEDYLLKSKGGEGNVKNNVNESSDIADTVISGGDAHMVSSLIQKCKKKKKRETVKEDMAGCPGVIVEATRKEKGGQISSAALSNYDERNPPDVKPANIEKNSNIHGSYSTELKKDAKKGKKKVTFSNKIEEFPPAHSSHKESSSVNLVWKKQMKKDDLNLVYGKWFTPEEDELIRKATMDYIEANNLGERGLYMVLHSSKYRKQVKDCWRVIASALPWRPLENTYLRAHTIFEKNVENKWEPEDLELLKRCFAKYGPNWKKFGEIFGKSRLQVKDTFRRIKPENLKKGKWGQVEYQALFDLVNLDLQLKALQEKKTSHCMLKGNISWESVSSELSTRGPQACCVKWYLQLTSSMVSEGHWNDLDDYKMIDAIQKADPSCFEDVDWDNLLEHRPGEICRKRWYEMIKYLDRFWAMSFIEQIDLLSQRYCPDMIPYIQDSNIKSTS